ncbi:hypothetical protein NDU88_008162 [Pleurodeles waltl]|uniref:Uncharacterized protein n=1 Tax=Pleurodeles waltl TaxID=8319 RepID=A0AAV7NYC4_PLEWA|nr:hypothetical protein NDU88_008162 [Pleurodeles waltl]
MRVYSRLIRAQPKAKGSGWKEYNTTALPYGSMTKGPDSASSSPLLASDSREADSSLPNRLITTFYNKVGEKVDKIFPLQQIIEQINEQTNKQTESELQLQRQDAAVAQEQEPVLAVPRTEDTGENPMADAQRETRGAECVKIDLAWWTSKFIGSLAIR